MSWAERAKAHFSQERPDHTDKTSETTVSSVLAVLSVDIPESTHEVSSVLAVEGDALLHKLIEAAMRACDHHGDGPEARAEMLRDIRETPLNLRDDLLTHFRQTYPGRQGGMP